MPPGKVPGRGADGASQESTAADTTAANAACSLVNDDSLHLVKDSLNILGKY